MDIAGKKAIVLGGTSGIGLATSLMLVEKGADVVAVSRDPSKAGDVPAGIRLAALDSRDSEAVEAFSMLKAISTFWSIQPPAVHAPLAHSWKWI